MKIYFAGSIRGGRNDKEIYLKLIQHLSNYGEVLTEHVGDQKLPETGEAVHIDRKIMITKKKADTCLMSGVMSLFNFMVVSSHYFDIVIGIPTWDTSVTVT